MNKNNTWLMIAAILGALGVIIGAFGAHSLKLEGRFKEVFQTGSEYHFYHTISILCISILYQFKPHKLLLRANLFFLVGIVLFSGSLYLLAVTEVGKLGAITPLGGIAFIIGWVYIVLYSTKKNDF